MQFKIENQFVDSLPADKCAGNTPRQVTNACYSKVQPSIVSAPILLSVSKEAAELVGLRKSDTDSDDFLQLVCGNRLPLKMQPYSMCYGGHQFGHWAGQLGDGRAINLAEVIGQNQQSWTLQLKGAGLTPYSRTADGLAVLRSSLREYICSEAMHHLGVPTTRALSLALTGDSVLRDKLYDGNAEREPGAIVCRLAPSFIRFGNFQIHAARQEWGILQRLMDFTIEHYFAGLFQQYSPQSLELYLAWFEQVCLSSMDMVVHWMRVGFVHGVMNTDNMSIHGLTIDYGPYGFLDAYQPDWTPNTTDSQSRRYRYSQQADIAVWNCYQLANALYPVLESVAEKSEDVKNRLESILETAQSHYQTASLTMMRHKLGLQLALKSDDALIKRMHTLLSEQEVDMTLFFRALSTKPQLTIDDFSHAFYLQTKNGNSASSTLPSHYVDTFSQWLHDYQLRLKKENTSFEQREKSMENVNPIYIFRNYLAQQAIELLEQGDTSMMHELMACLQNPYTPKESFARFAQKRPDWARNKFGCSMLSCSS